MAKQPAGPLKTFTNVEEVFDKMLELGFFVNGDHRAEQLAVLTEPFPDVHASNEHWYSNGVVEVKIFKQMFDTYELCNYRRQIHPGLDELFALAEIPRIG